MQVRTLRFSLDFLHVRVLQYSQIIGLFFAYNHKYINISPIKVGNATCQQLGRVGGPVTETFVEHSQHTSQLQITYNLN